VTIFVSFFFFFFAVPESGPCACKAGTLPLESLHHSFYVMGIFKIGSL
jgi:hypothetical protein